MARGDDTLATAKQSYRQSKQVGNRQEEARWANVIGDILKNRGEYVEALKWFRIDYDISNKYLPAQQVLPSCQCLGEVYLRLGEFKDALIYQKKHLELAKDIGDLIEQQRASTQLGRTYHEMFLKSEDDHYSVRNAKKYFNSAMKLAQTLKENPSHKSSFLKEYIDAHNNIGMLEMDLDNLEEAQRMLTKGLEICDEEEVSEDDDGRSRLHHNLGNVFMELRMWDKARGHIEKDIIICKRIGHRQGEAKGYINLGELHYRVQKYEDAILCYHKALDLARYMEDEDALVGQIDQNIVTVKEAVKVMDELKKEEQILKKLTRKTANAKGTSEERKFLLKQNSCLDKLIEKSAMIFAWLKHREFAKKKKRIATELCDKEKLSDAFLVIGESYQKLRDFKKAIKWYTKSWEGYRSIGNLEGQALVKINIGDVLDCSGDWRGAFQAFEEGYRISVESNLASIQLSALENMHYSHMMRFDNIEEARRLQLKIDLLKESNVEVLQPKKMSPDCCSETDTEQDEHSSDSRCNHSSGATSKSRSTRTGSLGVGDMDDDVPLISLIRTSRTSAQTRKTQAGKQKTSPMKDVSFSKTSSRLTSNQQTIVGHKRNRVVISDDEDDVEDDVGCSNRSLHEYAVEDVATSDEFKNETDPFSPKLDLQGVSPITLNNHLRPQKPAYIEESVSSHKSLSPRVALSSGKVHGTISSGGVSGQSNFVADGLKSTKNGPADLQFTHLSSQPLLCIYSKKKHFVTFKLDENLIHLEVSSCLVGDKLSIECLKVELACGYYFQLPIEKRSRGLLPIVQLLKCGGRVLESLENFDNLKDHQGNVFVEVYVKGWVQKRLMKLYIDSCEELSEAPIMNVLKKLYTSEIEDEINVSECELQDISVAPLFKALHTHKLVATLNVSHNLLGNGTMEKLQQFFASSGQTYGGLTLDLHCNRFGPTALFQICECPVLFTRLEVLNISGNRLTDACGSYLSTILERCKALYCLNIEQCSITSRTIQKIVDALNAGSVLSRLFIGHNHPISSNTITNLLSKLSLLDSFSELSLNGVKLAKPAVDGLCQFAKTSCLSRLMLEGSGIGTEGALQLAESLAYANQESLKLGLSYCGLTSGFIYKLSADITLSSCIIELHLGGNPLMREGANALTTLLTSSQCCLKVLTLSKCQLGLSGVLQVIQALAENDSLEELNLAENADPSRHFAIQCEETAKEISESLQPNISTSESSLKACIWNKGSSGQQGLCITNNECDNLEVADSEDEEARMEPAASGFNGSCASSCQKNSLPECQYLEQLSAAIVGAKHLQSLDLSDNGFSCESSEVLYRAWSSGLRVSTAWRHIEDKLVHFSLEENPCCRVKPCCKLD